MTLHGTLPQKPADPRLTGIIKLACLAVGGQIGRASCRERV